VLSSLSGFAPPLLLALGSRLVTVSPRLNMHTATTNVPGPQQPVQTLGRKMLQSYPFVPVVGSIRIVVAIFSYDGGLYFGVTGDYDGAPDIEELTAGIERGMRDLLALAKDATRSAGANGAAPAKAKTRARAKGPAGSRRSAAAERAAAKRGGAGRGQSKRPATGERATADKAAAPAKRATASKAAASAKSAATGKRPTRAKRVAAPKRSTG
jgi:hypothetical protein